MKYSIKLLIPLIFATLVLSQDDDADPYIICSKYPPSMNSWPAGYATYADVMWSRAEGPMGANLAEVFYTDNLDLCSSVYGIRGQDGASHNLGCRCLAPHTQPHCNPFEGDDILWSWPVRDNNFHRTLVDNCAITLCACDEEDHVNEYKALGLRGSAAFELNGLGEIVQVWDAAEAFEEEQADEDVEREALQGTLLNVTTSATVNEQCFLNCTSRQQCADNAGTDTCSCQVISSEIVPGAGSGPGEFKYQSECRLLGLVMDLAGSATALGPRKTMTYDSPCPCNASYVSYACCEAEKGLVWEAPEFYLGSLWTEDDL